MARVDESVRKAGQSTGDALRAAAPSAEAALRATPAAAGISRDTTVNVAAQRLARDLAAIPGHRALRIAPARRARSGRPATAPDDVADRSRGAG